VRRSLLCCAVLVACLSSATGPAFASSAPVANSDQACLIRVTASDAGAGDAFGGHLAISKETMVVTSDGSLGGDSRAAYVFVRSAEGWTQQSKIGVVDKPWCVAIDGDTMAVGLQDDDRSPSAFGVGVWVREGGAWRLQAQLPSGSGPVSSLAIDGDTLAVGVPYTTDPETGDDSPGFVTVYVREGDTWTLQQTLSGSAGPEVYYDNFGCSVDIEGHRLVVGAVGEGAPVRNTGAVYVFDRSGSVWSEPVRLTVPDAAAFDSLGAHVALDGNQIAAGAAGWSSQTGAVHIWQWDGTAWTSNQRITAPDGRPGNLVDYGGDSFGPLAIAGDTLVVGAPEDDDKGSNSGSLYVLKRVGDTWVHQRKIVAPDGAAGDYFGGLIAVDSGRVVVGVRGDDAPLLNSGSVYAFDLGFVTPVDTILTVEPGGILVNDALPDPETLAGGLSVSALAWDSVVAFARTSPAQGSLALGQDSGFTYTPAPGWKGADRFEYALTYGAATSNSATVTVETWQPTRLAISASNITPYYAASTTLMATLTTMDGAPVTGRTVVFEVLSGTKWVSVGSSTSGAGGVATRKVTGLTTTRTYRARTAYSSTFGAAGSGHLRVTPHASLSTPSVPSTVSRNRSFSVAGSIKPRHSSGSRPVQLQFYRYESGTWVLKKTVSPKVKSYSTYSKYTTTTSLPASGRWRVRAYHAADSANAAKSSGYRYLRVR